MKAHTFATGAILGRDGILIGAEASCNVTEAHVITYLAALSFSAPEYVVTVSPTWAPFLQAIVSVSPNVVTDAKAVYDTN